MIEVKNEGVLLSKTELPFENEGTINPAVMQEGESVHLFYRAVGKGNHSTIGYCRLEGPLKVSERRDKPFMIPEFEYERFGVEDPRIVKIDDEYYMTYTAYDGTNARGALATSKHLKHFKKRGLITPPITFASFISIVKSNGGVNERYYHDNKFYNPDADPEKKLILWDKDVIFFPRRIKGNLVFLHRIRPGIQLVSVKSIDELTSEFWENYFLNLQDHIVMDPVFSHESAYIGGGCPPIETEHGWLLIYHGAEETDKGIVYSACAAALLDLDNPERVIARLPYALFSPEYEWELKGYVDNVVFPTGTALFGDILYIYYGAADSRIACASLRLTELMEHLLACNPNGEK